MAENTSVTGGGLLRLRLARRTGVDVALPVPKGAAGPASSACPSRSGQSDGVDPESTGVAVKRKTRGAFNAESCGSLELADSETELGTESARTSGAVPPFARKTVIRGEPRANNCSAVCLGGANAASAASRAALFVLIVGSCRRCIETRATETAPNMESRF